MQRMYPPGKNGDRVEGTAEGTKSMRAQQAKDESAQCRVDTDLSGRAYLAASQDDDSTFDKNGPRQGGRRAGRTEESRL